MKRYLIIFLLLLATETAIAIFHFNDFIRYYLGDVIIIPLIVAFLKIFSKTTIKKITIVTLCLAIGLEIAQWFNSAGLLNINSKLLSVLLGSTFDWFDLLAYSIGALLTLYFIKNETNKTPYLQ